MNRDELLKLWLQEEEAAHIHGWDFSHIRGRYEVEQDLPWNYEAIVRQYLYPEHKLLDIDTGGGEFLLSLGHPCHNLAATENYPPNVELCQRKLLPLGIDFMQADGGRLVDDRTKMKLSDYQTSDLDTNGGVNIYNAAKK